MPPWPRIVNAVAFHVLACWRRKRLSLSTNVEPADEEVAVRYGISIPNFGAYAHARVEAELAREAEQPGWDGVFL